MLYHVNQMLIDSLVGADGHTERNESRFHSVNANHNVALSGLQSLDGGNTHIAGQDAVGG